MKKLFLLCACALVFIHPTFAQQRTSMDYVKEASVWFVTGEYKKAIKPYQKALDLEKQERKLERKDWLMLVNNLGVAYGITGDSKRFTSTLEYGIKEEPTYPFFYYNMARSYGERGDEDKAIEFLRPAFKYKKNVFEGQHLPDPMTDRSFEKFRKSEKFIRAVAEMKNS